MSGRRRRRSKDSYASRDPEKRAAQLANLRPGSGAAVGNTQTLRHGAYRELAMEAIEAKAVEIQTALEQDVPVAGAWGVPIRLLAETLLRLDSVSDFLRRRGWESDDGGVRPAAELEASLQRRALDLARELGLTPLAASKLGLNVARTAEAFDLAQAMSAIDDEDVIEHG